MHRLSRLILTALSILLISPSMPGRDHFISDPLIRKAVKKQLILQRKLAAHRHDELFSVLQKKMSSTEREMLEFLLAYAPLVDLAECDGEYFSEAVRYALKARREMPWGKRIPEDIFRHFVLPTRVNNEILDRFRPVMYEEIKKRVSQLSMKEAALEINHWCHEKVTYQSSDDRTSSPLNTVKTTTGRCGEESTFTVSALRTAGIPARQCYTPRWAHVDDNHAWVEVWVDGHWQYMGACEPETTLNCAWFDGPVKRAMLVHSMAYGRYQGHEQVLAHGPGGSMLNLLSRYSKTTQLTITVLDEHGLPSMGADVHFQLYNYAEFHTIHRQKSNKEGQVRFLTGLGDLLVWASKENRYGMAKVSARQQSTIDIVLSHTVNEEFSLDLDLTPPREEELPINNPAASSANNVRLKKEDDIRSQTVSTFIDENKTRLLAQETEVDFVTLWDIMKKSRGNWRDIKSFLEQTPTERRALAMSLLGIISEKDLRDVQKEVLQAHLDDTRDEGLSKLSDVVFVPYVLNPRIEYEHLKPFRQAIRSALPEKLLREACQNPSILSSWIDDHIRLVDDELNRYDIPITPYGVLSLRAADQRSKNIFSVAVCRSLGVPSRLEPGTQMPQYHINNQWHPLWPQREDRPSAHLNLEEVKNGTQKPGYSSHFTLGRWQEGCYKTLRYPFDTAIKDFPLPLKLPPGHYRLMTGIRLYNDDILTRLQFFNMEPDQQKTLPVSLRISNDCFSTDFTLPAKLEVEMITQGRRDFLYNLIPAAGAILCFIKTGHEPSRHLLDDLTRINQSLEEWGGLVILVLKERREVDSLKNNGLAQLPHSHIMVRIPVDQTDISARFVYPFCAFIDRQLSILYAQQGYRVGSDSQLLRAIDSHSRKKVPLAEKESK